MRFDEIKEWARNVKRDVVALWLAARDDRTPWYAKAVAAAVAAYALSPIDLIPDFVPILGYLDDVVLVPLGIKLAVKLIPPELLSEFRNRATEMSNRPVSRTAAAVFVLLWVICGAWFFWLARGDF